MSVKRDSSPVKPSDENIAQTKPCLQLWDSQQRTLLSHDQTHDPQKLCENKCVCYSTSAVIFYVAREN